VLALLGAELLVDGVDVRPGHPMLMARLADGRPLVGLPGNPLAAVSGLLTLVEPAVRALAGLPAPAPRSTTLTTAVKGHPRDVRLVPVSGGTPLHHVGPSMLRGLAAADALAVVPAGGAREGDVVETLALP
jgi:molybdopterin molybdotransferase